MVHTGQNYDDKLSKIFFDELDIRKPDYQLEMTGSFGGQLTKLMWKFEAILEYEKPDALLVLGDTNSALGVIIAKRLGIRVFHMEAGNRCYDDRVPEETNRRIIDHSSDILLPYTERSRQNLLREGIESQRIYVTGNPINEVLDCVHRGPVQEPQFVVTLHRSENVDNPVRLAKFIEAFERIVLEHQLPLIWPVHPHARQPLEEYTLHPLIKLVDPMGFVEFTDYERDAYVVLTDSGTVQEECAIFGVPVVTLRDSTERPETIEVGCNFISGCEPTDILRGIKTVLETNMGKPPVEYLATSVSNTVVRIILSYWR